MAAPCRKLARSVLLKGLCHIPGRSRWRQCVPVNPLQSVPPWWFLQRPLITTTPMLSTSRTQQPRSTEQQNTKEVPEEEESEGPEYIPSRKAKNPMMKIGYAWMIGLPAGIIGFILAKRQVDKNRLKQLRIRQRMKKANEGEYEGSRYRNNRLD
ncbi:hypothetical protein UPYG_G00294200 [Umbra pygmaea]|uniref:Uncharacterized protein n=1 Tax=Umbra pygmaea TaxID=75934 RepID=A0ABD0W9W6_UMBPY